MSDKPPAIATYGIRLTAYPPMASTAQGPGFRPLGPVPYLAEQVAWLAGREDMSVTAFVKLAIKQAMERSDTHREGGVTAHWAETVRRP